MNQFFESTAWLYAKTELKSEYMRAWESTQVEQVEERETLWKLLKTIGALEGILTKVLQNAEYAILQAEQEDELEQYRRNQRAS